MSVANIRRIVIGVGTPGRVLALIREGMPIRPHCRDATLTDFASCEGALKLDDLHAVVLDMSTINEKQQGIFDIRETHKDVLGLLNEPVMKIRLGDKTKLLVY